MNNHRSHRRCIRALGLAGGAALTLAACSAGDQLPREVGQTDEPIIAGVPANGASLNAIGSIGVVVTDLYSGTSYYEPYCSGSLIGKQTVLTAKHCLQFFARDYAIGAKTVFAIGPDAQAPVKLLEVVAVQGAPGDQGGYVGFGHDVGVMYLRDKVTDLKPLKIGELKTSDLNKKFIEIGYGVRDNTQAYGTRRTGNATLRARSGLVFEIIFGSFARFKAWYETGSPATQALFSTGPVAPAAFLPIARSLYEQLGPANAEATGASSEAGAPGAAGAPNEPAGGVGNGGSSGAAGEGPISSAGDTGGYDPDAYLRYIYDNTRLSEGYEAVFGGATGDAQACYGDSGSPIVRANANGDLVAYGVISGGLGSTQLICDFGGIDSVFGPEVKTFLSAAQQWVDPCKGLSVAGQCKGKTAQRCTSPLEGPRRPVQFNCGGLGQVCAVQADGTAGCSDP